MHDQEIHLWEFMGGFNLEQAATNEFWVDSISPNTRNEAFQLFQSVYFILWQQRGQEEFPGKRVSQ